MRQGACAITTSANYEESEMRIRQLLAAAGTGGGIDRESVTVEAHGPEVGADWGSLKSPETYVGYQKRRISRLLETPRRARVASMPFRLACASISGRFPVNGR